MSSDQNDRDDKTEEPTQRRLDKAHDEGELQIASDPFLLAVMLVGVGLLLAVPLWFASLKGLLGYFYDTYPQTGDGLASSHGLLPLLSRGQLWTLAILTIAGGAFVAVVLAGAAALRRFRVPFRPIKPDLANVSPGRGIHRIYGREGLTRSALNCAKVLATLACLSVVAYNVVLPRLMHFSFEDRSALVATLVNALIPLLAAALALLALFAAGDVVLRYFQNRRRMLMSHQDIRDEMKEQEGDPHIRARLKKIRRERRRKSRYALADADALITNPTHYAVGVKYVLAERRAPFLIDKGAGIAALRLIRASRRANVPILRYPSVARNLFFNVAIDEEIPESLYEDVARILLVVYQIKERRRKPH